MEIEDLEKLLSTYVITRSRIRDEDSENKSLPQMLDTFHELIVEDVPPPEKVFVDVFFMKFRDLRKAGITSRLKRAYLSYIREHHLGFLLKKYFGVVLYDKALDLSGIDYVIMYKEHTFYLHAYVNTRASRYWREIKNGRHDFFGTHIDLPLDLARAKRVGKFLLYKDSDIEELKESMDKFLLEERMKNAKSS
jgi:hypothetical protein